jgi:BMFP domain-containing protein YqiC
MLLPKQIEDLAKKLFASLPENVQSFETDIKQQFKEILHSAFAHLDIVTREEFDVQIKVLSRSREKIDALEKVVEQLLQEKNHSKKKIKSNKE